jgi:ABC-2 type transport system ATP-binding protein
MDEPAANLDPKARSEFFNSLVELKKEGKAILISSHILAEIDKYADSATILDGGKIIFSGKSSDLYNLFNKNE